VDDDDECDDDARETANMFFRSRRRRRAIETTNTDARTVAPFGFGAMSKRMSSTRGDRDDDAPRSSVTFETATETATETEDDDDGSVYDVVPRSPRSSTPRGDIEETSRGRRVPPRRDAARDEDEDDDRDRARTRPMEIAPEEDAGVTRPRTA
jgi:hypothetical protein